MTPDADKSTIDSRKKFPFWRKFYNYFSLFRKQMIIASIASLVAGGAIAMQPLMIKYIIDYGVANVEDDASTRLNYTLLFVGIYVFCSIVRLVAWSFGYRQLINALEGVVFNIRSRLFRHIQRLCFKFHDETSSGELFNYLMGTPVASIKNFFQQFAMSAPYMIVSWVVAFFILAFIDILLLSILLTVVILIIIVNTYSRKKVHAMSKDFMAAESTVSKYVADLLRGCREIKVHAAEDNVNHTFVQQIAIMRDKGRFLTYKQWIESMKPEALNYAGMAAIYLAGGYSCIYRDLSIGSFTAFIAGVGLLMQPLMGLININLTRANAEAGLERIERVLSTATTTPELPENMRTTIAEQCQKAKAQNVPCFEMRDVCFSYRDDQPVFHMLNCAIKDGQSVALVGASGSGKSTFVSLLLRLYDPQSGRVLIYGDDHYHYSLNDVRSSFGVVTQSPYFFQAPIIDNIRVTNPKATEEEVWAALETANAADFVQQMPRGLYTTTGESGFNMSGGQRQRVAIARALLAKPRFFIFDEATSALDNKSERRIQHAIDKLMTQKFTTIIIAHRLTTIQNVDRILVFEQGQIIQDGTFNELAQQAGVFQTLLQSSEDE